MKKSLKKKNYFVPITGSKMAAAARISLHIHKLVSKKGHWFLKKAKILPKLFESLVNIVTSFVWLRLYWLRLRRRKPLFFLHKTNSGTNSKSLECTCSCMKFGYQWLVCQDRVRKTIRQAATTSLINLSATVWVHFILCIKKKCQKKERFLSTTTWWMNVVLWEINSYSGNYIIVMSLQYNFFDGSQETLRYTYRFWLSSFPLFQHKTAISSRIKMGENFKTARNFDPVQDKQ